MMILNANFANRTNAVKKKFVKFAPFALFALKKHVLEDSEKLSLKHHLPLH